jgi:hypothetical protein
MAITVGLVQFVSRVAPNAMISLDHVEPAGCHRMTDLEFNLLMDFSGDLH